MPKKKKPIELTIKTGLTLDGVDRRIAQLRIHPDGRIVGPGMIDLNSETLTGLLGGLDAYDPGDWDITGELEVRVKAVKR